jgi:hypothetical protein
MKICPFSIDNVSSFSTGSGESLAVRIKNLTGSSVNLVTGGGYSFISMPYDKYKASATVDGHGTIKVNDNASKTYEYFFKNTSVKFESDDDPNYPDYTFQNWSYAFDNTTTYTVNPVRIISSDNYTYVGHFTSSGSAGNSNSRYISNSGTDHGDCKNSSCS